MQINYLCGDNYFYLSMRISSTVAIILTLTYYAIVASPLRDYSSPKLLFQRYTRSTYMPISFIYAEESQQIFIHDKYTQMTAQLSALYIYSYTNNNSYINNSKIQLGPFYSSAGNLSVDRYGSQIIWRFNNEIHLTNNITSMNTSLIFSIGSNSNGPMIKFSKDGKKCIITQLQKDSNSYPVSFHILWFQDALIGFQSFTQHQDKVIAATLMNKKNAFIRIYFPSIYYSDYRNYFIEEFYFNATSAQYEQNTTLKSLVRRFDIDEMSFNLVGLVNLRIGQNDDFLLFHSSNQAILLKRQGDDWVTKTRDIIIDKTDGRIISSQNGIYLLVKNIKIYSVLYKVSQDRSSFQKIAIIDYQIQPFQQYLTNEGNLFISNGNDLYYQYLLPSTTQGSSGTSSTTSAGQSKIFVNASTVLQINSPNSLQIDNSFYQLVAIIVLCILSLIIICLLCKYLHKSQPRWENGHNRIINESSIVMDSVNRRQKKSQSMQIVFQP